MAGCQRPMLSKARRLFHHSSFGNCFIIRASTWVIFPVIDYFPVISLEEAQEKILAAIQPLPAEEIDLHDAVGRYLAAPIHSPVDLPPADNSAMDGYAVRAADLAAATAQQPGALRLSGEARAGSAWAGGVEAGACVRIFTGAMLPRGADAVVMQEEAQ